MYRERERERDRQTDLADTSKISLDTKKVRESIRRHGGQGAMLLLFGTWTSSQESRPYSCISCPASPQQ